MSRIHRRRFLAAVAISASLIPIAFADTAYGQAGDAELVVDEIIVTAQRRSESIQDVPISITALSNDDLQANQIDATSDLIMVVPGLRVEATGAYIQPTIRGISTSVIAPTAEANVATYVDGVYQTTQIAAIYELPDVSSVEVLKGPQGTLFGRNATGGAILISSKKPDLLQPAGKFSASYGSFDEWKLKGYLSVPIVEDRLGISFSALYSDDNGYTRDILDEGRTVGGSNTLLLRGKLRLQPWDGADFVLTALRAERDDFRGIKQTNYLGNNAAAQTLPSSMIASRPWEFGGNEDPFIKSEQTSVSLRGEIDLGPGTLTTTTAYTKDENLLQSDTDNSPLAVTYLLTPGFVESIQQEIIYATDQIGRFRFTGGLFYYDNEGGQDLNVNRDAVVILQRDEARSYAAFGEVAFDATERLSLTAGVRYSRDRQRSAVAFVFGGGAYPDEIPQLGEQKWSAWTPRFTATYDFTNDITVYASYSKGFKAGLFNSISAQPVPVDPEKIDAFEVGLKGDSGRNFSFSAAAFYYDYRDLQLPAFILTDGIPRQVLRNAASSEIYGVELNGNWRPFDGLTLNVGVTYLHARYEDYPNAVINIPITGGGNEQIEADVSGNALNRSPSWSGNFSAQYSHETSLGELTASGNVFWSTKFFLESGNRIVQPSYALVNATLGLRVRDTGATIRLWGRNLTDKAVLTGTNISVGADSVLYGAPRAYGIEAIYEF